MDCSAESAVNLAPLEPIAPSLERFHLEVSDLHHIRQDFGNLSSCFCRFWSSTLPFGIKQSLGTASPPPPTGLPPSIAAPVDDASTRTGGLKGGGLKLGGELPHFVGTLGELVIVTAIHRLGGWCVMQCQEACNGHVWITRWPKDTRLRTLAMDGLCIQVKTTSLGSKTFNTAVKSKGYQYQGYLLVYVLPPQSLIDTYAEKIKESGIGAIGYETLTDDEIDSCEIYFVPVHKPKEGKKGRSILNGGAIAQQYNACDATGKQDKEGKAGNSFLNRPLFKKDFTPYLVRKDEFRAKSRGDVRQRAALVRLEASAPARVAGRP